MTIQSRKGFGLIELLTVILLFFFLALMIIPQFHNLPTNEELVVMRMVQQYEEIAGRNRPDDSLLIVRSSSSRGPGIYTVRNSAEHLLWVVNSNTGQVDQADPDTGEIIENSEDSIELIGETLIDEKNLSETERIDPVPGG